MPGPKSTSSVSSKAASVAKAEKKPELAAESSDDDGIPLSVLHMISNKDNVRDDVDHAELFAHLRNDGQGVRDKPRLNLSKASSVVSEAPKHRHRRRRGGPRGRSVGASDDEKRGEEDVRVNDRVDEHKDDHGDEAEKVSVHEDVPLSPKSSMRRKGVLLQELYMHLGQINSSASAAMGKLAPIRALDMNASLEDVEIEVERAKAVVDQIRAIKFMRKGLVTVASAAEFSNKRFNPWPLELDGFADFLNSGIGEYDNCFMKLHQKYKGRTQEMSPEMELLFLFGSSAFMFHLSKSFAKSAMSNANFSAAVASAMAAQQAQQQQTRAVPSRPEPDAVSVAGTTASQQMDDARLVDRLKKANVLPPTVTKLAKV